MLSSNPLRGSAAAALAATLLVTLPASATETDEPVTKRVLIMNNATSIGAGSSHMRVSIAPRPARNAAPAVMTGATTPTPGANAIADS